MNPKQKAIKDHYIKAFIDSGMSEEEAEAKWNEYFDAYKVVVDKNSILNAPNVDLK